MEQAIQCMAGISFLIWGLSTLLRTPDWAALMQTLAASDTRMGLLMGSIALMFGAFIIAFHPVWDGLPVILTIIGWMAIIEGALYLMYPEAMPIIISWCLKHPAITVKGSGILLILVAICLLAEKTVTGWLGVG